VLATHNFEEAAEACDRVAMLSEGELMAVESANEVSAQELRDFYLELIGSAPEKYRIVVPA
jgi:ABC-type sulfate/molybdate transport systems ATPase subunit